MKFSVAQEILQLVELGNKIAAGERPLTVTDFAHVVLASGRVDVGGGSYVPATGDCKIFSLALPANYDYLLTHVGLRCYPNTVPIQEPWDFEGLDQRGYGSLRLRVNKAESMANNTLWVALSNSPCLFVFNGNSMLDVFVNRREWDGVTSGFPDTVELVVRLNCYSVPQGCGARFAQVGTRVITAPAALTLT